MAGWLQTILTSDLQGLSEVLGFLQFAFLLGTP